MTFALYFGHRGIFPSEVIDGAREELKQAVSQAGYDCLCMDAAQTHYGAVETREEGRRYRQFLQDNRGRYDGIIVSLPNFGDENGVLAALGDAEVPILVQAFPDELGQMDVHHRRDAMCGKFAVCNVLRQAGVRYTLTKSFTVRPCDAEFADDLKHFAAVCRVVKGMKAFNLGAVGARATPFKTVRVDETALQRYGINVETIDLTDVFADMKRVSKEEIERSKQSILKQTVFSGFAEEKLTRIAALQAVLERIIEQYNLQAVAVRCGSEFQTEWGIVPCTNIALLNEKGICAACEVDIENAVMMRALSLAADAPCTLLDFNNNYGSDPDKAIMFHCGPVPPRMLTEKGRIAEHVMYKNSYADGCVVGVHQGTPKSGDVTIGSIKTENGKICAFAAEAAFTDDVIDRAFFGCGKVIYKQGLNDLANYMARSGYKHHLCVVYGRHMQAVREAFDHYLGYDIQIF